MGGLGDRSFEQVPCISRLINQILTYCPVGAAPLPVPNESVAVAIGQISDVLLPIILLPSVSTLATHFLYEALK